MELAHHQNNPPPPCTPTKGAFNRIFKHHQTTGVEQPQDTSHHELCMLKAYQGDNRLTQPCEHDRSHKCSGHSTGKREVVVGLEEARVDVGRGGAVDEDVMRGLEGE